MYKTESLAPVSIELSCKYLQIDNQMYASVDSNEPNHRYDFPVIFLPRNKLDITKPLNIYQTLESEIKKPLGEDFLTLKLQLIPDENTEQQSMRLSDIELDIKSFEIYLEDYFLYNLVKVIFEFVNTFQGAGFGSGVKNEEANEYDLISKDLDILLEPLVMLKKIRLSKYFI